MYQQASGTAGGGGGGTFMLALFSSEGKNFMLSSFEYMFKSSVSDYMSSKCPLCRR